MWRSKSSSLTTLSRRLSATGLHPDAELACSAITMAVAARVGAEHIAGVIFHTDRGSIYTAEKFTALCRRLGIRQSMGRVGSCFDNAAAEAFFSSLDWEVLSRHQFATTAQARATVIDWCYGFYNHQPAQRRRRPVTDQLRDRRPQPRSGIRNPPRFRANHKRGLHLCLPDLLPRPRDTELEGSAAGRDPVKDAARQTAHVIKVVGLHLRDLCRSRIPRRSTQSVAAFRRGIPMAMTPPSSRTADANRADSYQGGGTRRPVDRPPDQAVRWTESCDGGASAQATWSSDRSSA